MPVGGVNDGRAVHLVPGFRAIGSAIGIFEYRASTYFDTFFDNHTGGDFENHRKYDANLQDVLGVFLRKDGRTRQICEYNMHDQGDR